MGLGRLSWSFFLDYEDGKEMMHYYTIKISVKYTGSANFQDMKVRRRSGEAKRSLGKIRKKV